MEGLSDAENGAGRERPLSGETGVVEEIDENMLLEAMPDFTPFLPNE